MRLYIITGTASGIGASLAEQLLSPSSLVHCISEHENSDLLRFARMRQLALYYNQINWSDTEALLDWLENILSSLNPTEWESICFIHSAATLGPLRKWGEGKDTSQDIKKSLDVNLLLPVLWSEKFIAHTQSWNLDKKMLFMGSKYISEPVSGLSSYCVSKSGIEMLVKSMRKEQENQEFPILTSCLYSETKEFQLLEGEKEKLGGAFQALAEDMNFSPEAEKRSAQYAAREIINQLQDVHFGKEMRPRFKDMEQGQA